MSRKGSKGASKSARGGGIVGYAKQSFCSQPFRDEELVTLRYQTTVDTTTSASIYNYQFRINSVFDPDYTSVGYQPLGFDQWASIYSRYTVYSCEAVVTAVSRTASGMLNVGVAANTDNTVLSFAGAASMRRGKVGSTTGGARPIVIRLNTKVHETFGVAPEAIDIDDFYSAATSTNAGKTGYLNISCQTSGATDSLSLQMELRYKVKFWMPSLASVSTSYHLNRSKAMDPTLQTTPTTTSSGATVTKEDFSSEVGIVARVEELEKLLLRVKFLRSSPSGQVILNQLD